MDIIERLDAAIKTEDFWIGDQREDNILKDSKKIIEQLREVLGMWLRYSKSDYDDHAQMIIDWSQAEAATKSALKEKE
jgi:hypothetical protein